MAARGSRRGQGSRQRPPALRPEVVDVIRQGTPARLRRDDGHLWAYQPVRSPWRVGYGSQWNWDVGVPVQRGVVLTQWTAEVWLAWDVEVFAAGLWRQVGGQVAAEAWSAVVVVAWEVGLERLTRSAFLAAIRAGEARRAVGLLTRLAAWAGVAPPQAEGRRRQEILGWVQGR